MYIFLNQQKTNLVLTKRLVKPSLGLVLGIHGRDDKNVCLARGQNVLGVCGDIDAHNRIYKKRNDYHI